jgi:diguanylate cyclase (GGDEF)-like protein
MPTSTAEQPTERRSRFPRETVLVAVLAAGLLALGAAIGLPWLDEGAHFDSPGLPWWAIAIAFAATEASVLHLQVKREAQTVSLSELPLVLGLFFASPVGLVAGRALGAGVVLVALRRTPPLKTAFNLALMTAEVCVALAVFHGLGHWSGHHELVLWAASYAGALLASAVGIIAIGLVIAVYEGGLRPKALLREAVLGQPAGPMAVTIGLIAVTSLSASLHSALLLVAFGALLLLAYRAYASLAERHLNLERMYRFTQVVSSAPEIDEVLANVLSEAKTMLRSERAAVVFVGSEGGVMVRVRLGVTGRLSRSEDPPTSEDAWLVREVVERGEPRLMERTTRDPAVRALLARHDMRDAVAVPLRGEGGIVGTLLVADRLGDVRSFDGDDVLLLETVANHASVALRNGELIGQLRHEALHDALTGLPNRVYLQRRLAEALDDVAAGRAPGAGVMILDLDEFKGVNDTLGHGQGDLLLVEVGARIAAAVGQAGAVARLGGDEFAVLLPGTADRDRVRDVGQRILRSLEQPVALDELEVGIGASIGIALSPEHAADPAALLKRADMAMYDAKVSAAGLRIYDADLDTNSPRRLALVGELRTALDTGAIEVHVQPKARLDSGAVTGAEALVRWTHPQLGVVRPDEFIPVAERSGLIGRLTAHVLDTSLRACAAWRAAGHDVGVAVNLSARSLLDADLVPQVARLLRRHRVPGSSLTLEVTEGSVMSDPSRAVALLHQLRGLGVRLSVDDFGTGYSSLSYLKRLPVHEVKIDRSFVSGLREGGEDVGIVRAIIDLGRNLGLEVVAEGVEDEETWDLLRDMGCDLVQGWHLARAMPTDDVMAWLRARERGGVPAELPVV